MKLNSRAAPLGLSEIGLLGIDWRNAKLCSEAGLSTLQVVKAAEHEVL